MTSDKLALGGRSGVIGQAERRVVKIAMIGAGSVVFSRNLTGDILSFPELADATLTYMDIDHERLEVGAALCRKTAAALGASPKIEATLDRAAALDGADFVINMMQVGGFDSTLIDFEIPRKYGLNFTIADTTGPGGLFRALRTYPAMRALCQDMERLCPRAMLLNYANPMSMNMQTITRTSSVASVGLCHSVQGTLNELMDYLREKPEEIAFTCAGINHMAFYLRLEKDGIDLYPRLFAAMSEPAVWGANPVRFELMKRLGYFVTESSEHNAEYSAHFLARGALAAARFNVPIDEYLRRCDCSAAKFEKMKKLSHDDQPITVHRSPEYGSTIIHAMVSGTPAVVYGNMPNGGAISSLPTDAIVEAPTLVDRGGLRMTTIGELPPQLVGYMQPHVTQHALFIRAAMEGRRDCVYQAAMFDPLTAAVLDSDQIVQMCDELIAAHGFERDGGVLPELDSRKSLVSTGGLHFDRVDPSELRRQWRRRADASLREYIRDWHVIGPFPCGKESRRGLEMSTPLETRLIENAGAIDVDEAVATEKGELRWTPATADDCGLVNLDSVLGPAEWAVAYAVATVFSESDREVVLRIGSNDGIRVWVNGTPVHWHEVRRAYRADSDAAAAKLSAGKNRIGVKVDSSTGGCGFGVAVGWSD